MEDATFNGKYDLLQNQVQLWQKQASESAMSRFPQHSGWSGGLVALECRYYITVAPSPAELPSGTERCCLHEQTTAARAST
ncbi:hypothetical protein HPP92_000908 [Vanilla planifolia]|uniref:Uncharacterized protein n=1 Tax=Vanilla planifolia TaxID=51239 RepID=A0A835S363_VANPL|nr:hypothetical protein HPP92_000908 [Vanilla planifolia]